MAAALASMRNALRRLGFDNTTTRIMTDVQGVTNCLELGRMRDADITGFCKSLRSPGGTVPNDAAAITGGAAVVVRNPGTNVTPRAEANLKLTCNYVRHVARVARMVTPVDTALNTQAHRRESQGPYG